MALDWLKKFSIKQETRSFYIARPPEYAERLIYLHPDRSVPRGAKLTVRSDECALFFREGKLIGKIDTGTYLLDTANLPFLGHLIVDEFTNANHFICELFFVTTREWAQSFEDVEVGQFRDSNSRNVVKVLASFGYTVRIADPARLIIGLGGQNKESQEPINEVLRGRAATTLRQSVAQRAQRADILDVVSNIDVDAIGQELVTAARAEFLPLGLDVIRAFDLRLDLDDESRERLVEFGQMEAKLAYQAKGASIATQDGFAHFNAVQGQLAAMEGLGKGLSTGNSPMLLSGNIGGLGGPNLTPSYASNRRNLGAGSTPLSNQASFVLVDGNGGKGPFTPRQLALVLIAEGLDPQATTIRRTDDPATMAFAADLEPLVMAEYNKRKKPEASPRASSTVASALLPNGQSIDLLEAAMQAAAVNGSVSPEAQATLIQMAQSLGIASDPREASLLILGLAAKAGLNLADPDVQP